MLEKLPDAIGEALHNVRAGIDKALYTTAGLRQGMGLIGVTSLAFADHAPLPAKYTADGAGLSPPLAWRGVPAGCAELALIVEDVDAPTPQPLVHAIVVALPGEDGAIGEGAMGGGDAAPVLATGLNSLLQAHWLPPDPPPGHGLHRYLFQLFALGAGEPLAAGTGRDALREQVAARAIASGCLVGTYERADPAITLRSGETAAASPQSLVLPGSGVAR